MGRRRKRKGRGRSKETPRKTRSWSFFPSFLGHVPIVAYLVLGLIIVAGVYIIIYEDVEDGPVSGFGHFNETGDFVFRPADPDLPPINRIGRPP